jgi:ABC-2 type transport system permease protein
MALIAMVFGGLGTAIGSKLQDMQGFQLIMNFLVMPTFFLSGALFPLDHLPKVLGFITDMDPLSYGIDGLRGALIGRTHFGLLTDLAVLSAVAVVLVSIGSYLFSQIEI